MADERFPIQEGPSVPWEFMAPYESQCQKNHGQSLKRIAERGGLGPSEAWAVVNGIRYYEIKDEHGKKWLSRPISSSSPVQLCPPAALA